MARLRSAAVAAVLLAVTVPGRALAGWAEPDPRPLNADPNRSAGNPHMGIYGDPLVVWEEAAGGWHEIRASLFQERKAWTRSTTPVSTAKRDARDPTVAYWLADSWVAWRESNLSVYQVRARTWYPNCDCGGPISPPLNVDPTAEARAPYIAFVTKVPFVAWQETGAGGAQQIWVRSWNGSAWVMAGSNSLNVHAATDAVDPAVADVNGVAYVAWREDAPGPRGDQIHVKAFEAGSWVDVGGTSLNVDPSRSAGKPSVISVRGTPYVAWTESNGTAEQVHVKRFEGGQWRSVGGSLNVDPARSAADPTVRNVRGDPMVAWGESDGTMNRIRAKILRDGSWRSVGGPLNSAPGADPVLANARGAPYVAWVRTDSPTEIRVKRLDPDILASSARPSARSAVLSAQVDDFNVRLPIGLELSTRTAAFGTYASNAHRRISPGTGVSTVSRTFDDLRPGTRYFFRAFSSEYGGFPETSIGATGQFTTVGRPRITDLSVAPRSFAAGRDRPGAVVSFTSSEGATTTFVVQKWKDGAYVKAGAVTRHHGAGVNHFNFRGRLRGRTLAPGLYRFKAVARNDAGKSRRPVFAAFRITG
ncbi:MAG: large repetitive protein [Thermoleophilaceae bacterium]|nr:large repetitive protein [Thermoleophilaceae bacterium]